LTIASAVKPRYLAAGALGEGYGTFRSIARERRPSGGTRMFLNMSFSFTRHCQSPAASVRPLRFDQSLARAMPIRIA